MIQVLLIVLGLFLPTIDFAVAQRSTSAIGSCSAFSGFPALDGCSAAPGTSPSYTSALQYRDPAAFTVGHLFQTQGVTPISGLHSGPSPKINWNVAGVDFPVGVAPCASPTGCFACTWAECTTAGIYGQDVYCNGMAYNGATLPCSTTPGATYLIDASEYAWGSSSDPAQTGCGMASNYNKTQHYVVTCVVSTEAGPATVNLIGFDFAPVIDGVANSCVGIKVTEARGGVANGGTINQKHTRFFAANNAACAAPIGASLGQGVLTNYYGTPFWFNTNISEPWTYDVEYNMVDLQSQNAFNTLKGPGTNYDWFNVPYGEWQFGQTGLHPYLGRNKIVFRYNWLPNQTRNVFQANNSCNGLDVSYNVLHNLNYYAGTGHGEFFVVFNNYNCPGYSPGVSFGNMSYMKVRNNLMFQDAANWNTTNSQFLDMNVIAASPAGLLNIGAVDVELNVAIANLLTVDGIHPRGMNNSGAPQVPTTAGSGYAAGDIVQFTPTFFNGATHGNPCSKPITATLNGALNWFPIIGGECYGIMDTGPRHVYNTTAITGARNTVLCSTSPGSCGSGMQVTIPSANVSTSPISSLFHWGGLNSSNIQNSASFISNNNAVVLTGTLNIFTRGGANSTSCAIDPNPTHRLTADQAPPNVSRIVQTNNIAMDGMVGGVYSLVFPTFGPGSGCQ
jgi:hypothetical protein